MDDSQIEVLLTSLNSAKVCEGLGLLADRKDMRDLNKTIAFIRHIDPVVKKAATEATVKILRSSIIENFQQLSHESRVKLGELIDRIHPDIVQELLRDIHSHDETSRIHSLMILGVLRRRTSISTQIEKELKSNNVKIRATAVQAMGHYPQSSEHLLLLKQLNDTDSRVRANAIEALEQYDDPKLVFSLKRLMNDGSNRVRANALKALYRLGNQNIEDDIVTMLNDRSLAMVASGLWLIGELGIDTPEIRTLCKMFQNHPDPMIRRNCEKAVAQFGSSASHW